jgi:hypothetical protein
MGHRSAEVPAVALNVTVADPASAGYITVWPSGTHGR